MFFFGFGLCIFCSLLKGSVPRDIRFLLLTTVGPEPNIALKGQCHEIFCFWLFS
jgi:hypothetical protein